MFKRLSKLFSGSSKGEEHKLDQTDYIQDSLHRREIQNMVAQASVIDTIIYAELLLQSREANSFEDLITHIDSRDFINDGKEISKALIDTFKGIEQASLYQGVKGVTASSAATSFYMDLVILALTDLKYAGNDMVYESVKSLVKTMFDREGLQGDKFMEMVDKHMAKSGEIQGPYSYYDPELM